MNVEVITDLEGRFAEMKRFVRFSTDDEEALRSFAPKAEPHLRRIATVFYDRVREHEQAYLVFRDEDQLRNMPNILEPWLRRVLVGPYDGSFAQRSAAIGRVHVQVGLPQRYMFTAMNLFRHELASLAHEQMGEEAQRVERAIHRILDIELAMMNGAYRQATIERAQRIERESQAHVLDRLEITARRYVRAIDVAGAITIGVTGEGGFCIFNREAERVTGYALSDLDGADLSTLFVDVPGAAPITTLMESLRERLDPAVVDIEAGLKTKSGKVRRFRGRLSHLPAEPETEAITLLSGLDVTEQQASARRESNAERLAAVGTLAAGLAHEIRNPLNGAQLHLTFARRSLGATSAPDVVDALDVVAGELNRLRDLVSEFLEFARPGPTQRKMVSINTICEQVARDLEEHRRRSGARFSLDLLEDDLELCVDAPRLAQAIGNLVDNAFDAVSDSRGTVQLRVFREPWNVVVEVTDDGPGFPEDAPVFDAFFSTKPQGTGMGLAVAHRIARDHDGGLDVLRHAGETTFQMRLPLPPLESEEDHV